MHLNTLLGGGSVCKCRSRLRIEFDEVYGRTGSNPEGKGSLESPTAIRQYPRPRTNFMISPPHTVFLSFKRLGYNTISLPLEGAYLPDMVVCSHSNLGPTGMLQNLPFIGIGCVLSASPQSSSSPSDQQIEISMLFVAHCNYVCYFLEILDGLKCATNSGSITDVRH